MRDQLGLFDTPPAPRDALPAAPLTLATLSAQKPAFATADRRTAREMLESYKARWPALDGRFQ